MNYIDIKLLSRDDTDQLFQFEKENRLYFENIGLGRVETYYDRVSFEKIIDDLISEQEQGIHYMYLVINRQGEIVGRVNLVNVTPFPFKKAELGYRIGKCHQGNGYATTAVEKALKVALTTHDLHRIEAGTSPENIVSQKVLNKNSFRYVGRYNQYIFQEDRWVDSLLYERILESTENA